MPATISNVSVEDLDKESFDILGREALRSGRMTKEDLEISNAELLEDTRFGGK
jgi:ATP-dependent DNA helicase RecG